MGLEASKFIVRLAVAALLATALASIISVTTVFIEAHRNTDQRSHSNGTAIGGDFACFYAAGQIFNDDRTQLYNPEHQQQVQRRIFAGRVVEFNDLLFVYPPIVAAGFSFLAELSFYQAYIVWSLISLSLFIGALLILSSELRLGLGGKLLVITIGLGFVPYSINTLAAGQLSAVGLMMLVLVGAALSRGRHQLAGFVFSLTYYKPPLFLLLLVYLSICYRGRFIRGFLIGALALCGATALIVPASVIQANLGLMGGYHYGSDSTTSFGAVHWPKHGAGLLALLTILTERQFFEAWLLYFSLSILLILGWWRADLAAAARGVSRDLRISFSIACSLFLSIQMVVYDLTLLLIPLFTFGTAVARTQRPVRGLGFLVVGAAAIYLEFLARSWKFGEAGDAVATPLAFTVVLLSFYVVLTSFEGSRAGAGPGKLLAEKSTD